MPFYPGPGLGGHCIPIDPFYLTWKAREYGVVTRFIELAGEINASMPDFVVQRAMEVLNDFSKPMKGAKVLLLGLAYKPNVDDDRESPSYRLIEKLEERGAIVDFNDPYIPVVRPSREYAKYAGRRSAELGTGYDLFLISTAHDTYRGMDLTRYGVPILDTRNVAQGIAPKVHRA
jgi:UDP-N-acetyl-D-glucosamine dehydrogenase